MRQLLHMFLCCTLHWFVSLHTGEGSESRGWCGSGHSLSHHTVQSYAPTCISRTSIQLESISLIIVIVIIQVKSLRAGADVVVATPGRLEDLVQEGSCRLSGVTYLVLDEADRMLDLGFEPHIRSAQGLAIKPALMQKHVYIFRTQTKLLYLKDSSKKAFWY